VPVTVEHENSEDPLDNTRLWAYHEVLKYSRFDVSGTKIGQEFQERLEENMIDSIRDTIEERHIYEEETEEEYEQKLQSTFEDYEVKVRYMIDIYYGEDKEDFIIEGQRELSHGYHEPIKEVLFTKKASEIFQQDIEYPNLY
jgi:hypothetical protein